MNILSIYYHRTICVFQNKKSTQNIQKTLLSLMSIFLIIYFERKGTLHTKHTQFPDVFLVYILLKSKKKKEQKVKNKNLFIILL